MVVAYLLKWLYWSTFPPTVCEGVGSSTTSPTLGMANILNFSHSNGIHGYLTVVLMCFPHDFDV